MRTLQVLAEAVTPTTTGVEVHRFGCVVGALDVTISVTLPDGSGVAGEVTLAPHEYDGRWSAWGQPECWMSEMLVTKLREAFVDDSAHGQGNEFRKDFTRALADIELAAREACNAYSDGHEHEPPLDDDLSLSHRDPHDCEDH